MKTARMVVSLLYSNLYKCWMRQAVDFSVGERDV